jgi:S-adenosylmethionine-diacylgycerolhomoserine-N-methlytransferase
LRSALRAWLAKFHVSPRDSLREVLESECRRAGANLGFDTLYRGYAIHVALTKA